jgi:hypothetical protein
MLGLNKCIKFTVEICAKPFNIFLYIWKPLSKCIIIHRNHLQNFASDVLGSLQAILVASPVSIMNMMNMDDMQRRVLLSGMDLPGGGGAAP